MKLVMPEHLFKRWVTISLLLKDEIQMHRNFVIRDVYETYVNFILIPGKKENEISFATCRLETKFKNKIKSWYWEYNKELHYLKDAERFMWLYKKLFSILEQNKFNKAFYDTFIHKFDSNYIEMITDSELFD